jgi:hypothetical protein
MGLHIWIFWKQPSSTMQARQSKHQMGQHIMQTSQLTLESHLPLETFSLV